jgi:hypothetical protein
MANAPKQPAKPGAKGSPPAKSGKAKPKDAAPAASADSDGPAHETRGKPRGRPRKNPV